MDAALEGKEPKTEMSNTSPETGAATTDISELQSSQPLTDDIVIGNKVESEDSATDEDEEVVAHKRLELVEEDEGGIFREPVNDGREATFLTRSVNPYLQCGICDGYLKDAVNVTECTHSFCRSCYILYLNDRNEEKAISCPKDGCHVNLGTEPLSMIRPDPTVQSIVDKLFPEFQKAEYELEKKICLEKGLDEPTLPESKGPVALIRRFLPQANGQDTDIIVSQSATDSPSKESKPAKRLKTKDTRSPPKMRKTTDDAITFSLICSEPENGDPRLKPLSKPSLRTAPQITMLHLKKFIVQKLGLNEDDVRAIEILCRGAPVGNEHSLVFVRNTQWLHYAPTDQNLVLTFQSRQIDF